MFQLISSFDIFPFMLQAVLSGYLAYRLSLLHSLMVDACSLAAGAPSNSLRGVNVLYMSVLTLVKNLTSVSTARIAAAIRA